jgi:hypothetical protein
LLELPVVIWPVVGSTRAEPSEKNSLAVELARMSGRKAPYALRRWADAVATAPLAETTCGCTRRASRIASARVTVRSWAASGTAARPGPRHRRESAPMRRLRIMDILGQAE